MARKLLAGVVVTAALGVAGSAAAFQLPIIRSVGVAHRHLVLRLSVGDVRPTELTVAKHGAVNADGALLQRNVRLREAIQLPVATTGVVRWRSPATLRRGTYFVQVKAVVSGAGMTDCPRSVPNCNERWSNVRRVIVAPSR
jgi:hypothetical protein